MRTLGVNARLTLGEAAPVVEDQPASSFSEFKSPKDPLKSVVQCPNQYRRPRSPLIKSRTELRNASTARRFEVESSATNDFQRAASYSFCFCFALTICHCLMRRAVQSASVAIPCFA